MSRLQVEPTSAARSVPELLALARGMSLQAVELYRDLGRRMADLGNASAREAFERIEAMQREHASVSDGADVDPTADIFDDEELGGSRLVTPYMAYSLAVRNEERAFAFWTYMSAHAADPAVRSEAERLARTEIEHVRALRAARRRAYHERRSPDVSTQTLRTASLPDLRREAARREAALADLHGRVAQVLAESGDPAASMVAEIAREEEMSARSLGGAAQDARQSAPLPREPEALLAVATERLEGAVELYLVAAEQSRREDVVAAAQELADKGIRRLSRLR